MTGGPILETARGTFHRGNRRKIVPSPASSATPIAELYCCMKQQRALVAVGVEGTPVGSRNFG